MVVNDVILDLNIPGYCNWSGVVRVFLIHTCHPVAARVARVFFALWVLAGFQEFAAAETPAIVFAVPPVHSEKKTHEIYAPLADYLTEKTGVKVRLITTDNFLEYSRRMRNGEFDLIFDGSHFISWRIVFLDHEVLARLSGNSIFILFTRNDRNYKDYKYLISRKICSLPSPNIATLSIQSIYNNPVQQPIFVSAKSFNDVKKCVLSGKAVAGIVPLSQWLNWDDEGQTETLDLLYSTLKNPLPSRAFSVSRKVSKKIRIKLKRALLAADKNTKAAISLKQLRQTKFVTAYADDYFGVSELLKTAWGFIPNRQIDTTPDYAFAIE